MSLGLSIFTTKSLRHDIVLRSAFRGTRYAARGTNRCLCAFVVNPAIENPESRIEFLLKCVWKSIEKKQEEIADLRFAIFDLNRQSAIGNPKLQ